MDEIIKKKIALCVNLTLLLLLMQLLYILHERLGYMCVRAKLDLKSALTRCLCTYVLEKVKILRGARTVYTYTRARIIIHSKKEKINKKFQKIKQKITII